MDCEIGDIVNYRWRTVKIENFGEKDGERVFDGEVVWSSDETSPGDKVWGRVSAIRKKL